MGDTYYPLQRKMAQFSPMVRAVAAVVLTFAAVAKLSSLLLSIPSSAIATFEISILAALEIGLATWIFSSRHPLTTHTISLVVFFTFSGVSLGKWWTGYASCGCLGEIATAPLFTFAIDVVLLAGLLLSFPLWNLSRKAAVAIPISGLTVGILGFLGSVVASSTQHPNLFHTPQESASVIKPEFTVGQPLPFGAHLKRSCDLAQGSWLVVIVRPGCSRCKAQLVGLASETQLTGVAVIEVPGVSASERDSLSYPSFVSCVSSLSPQIKWRIETPLLLHLSDGKVERVIFHDDS